MDVAVENFVNPKTFFMKTHYYCGNVTFNGNIHFYHKKGKPYVEG